jgi:hypothetical protein
MYADSFAFFLQIVSYTLTPSSLSFTLFFFDVIEHSLDIKYFYETTFLELGFIILLNYNFLFSYTLGTTYNFFPYEFFLYLIVFT